MKPVLNTPSTYCGQLIFRNLAKFSSEYDDGQSYIAYGGYPISDTALDEFNHILSEHITFSDGSTPIGKLPIDFTVRGSVGGPLELICLFPTNIPGNVTDADLRSTTPFSPETLSRVADIILGINSDSLLASIGMNEAYRGFSFKQTLTNSNASMGVQIKLSHIGDDIIALLDTMGATDEQLKQAESELTWVSMMMR